MKGVLIYDTIGRERNSWFISELLKNAEAAGMELRLMIIGEPIPEDVDFAIVRTIAPSLSNELESMGIKVFNNAKTSEIANDKWKTFLKCQELGISCMPTFTDISSISEFPCIMKSRDGHGGSEVFWIENDAEYQVLKSKVTYSNKTWIFQRPATDLGKDVRLFAMGDRIMGAVMRYNDRDFRSNYSQGGDVSSFTPTDEQIKIARTLINELDSDYIGVDFIFDHGKWILNEIEDVCGARTLYLTSNTDVAKEYVEHIRKTLSGN